MESKCTRSRPARPEPDWLGEASVTPATGITEGCSKKWEGIQGRLPTSPIYPGYKGFGLGAAVYSWLVIISISSSGPVLLSGCCFVVFLVTGFEFEPASEMMRTVSR